MNIDNVNSALVTIDSKLSDDTLGAVLLCLDHVGMRVACMVNCRWYNVLCTAWEGEISKAEGFGGFFATQLNLNRSYFHARNRENSGSIA